MSTLPSHLIGLCAVLAMACSGTGDDSGVDPGSLDVDGDGFIADEDCDDSDAEVYPGAEETWYDDIDSDCGNDDDHDADLDGIRTEESGGADCDDSDATIGPGVDEIWYDGIDSDCRGDDDYDMDADGFQAEGKIDGGSDCDDSDPSVYLGASDTWYDGIDGNCDGLSDYDADGDGFDSQEDGLGDDCDDTDEEIHPGAVEIWYDGIDGDCGEDDDYDADADGYVSDSEGGDDCNDQDAEAYPGTLEQIDGHDTDCDGYSDYYGIEEDFGGTYIIGSNMEDALGAALAIGDLDADGLDDLIIMQEFDDGESAGGYGQITIGLGSSLGSSPTVSSSLDFAVATTLNSGTIDSLVVLSDSDGDGAQDLLIGASGYAGGDGGAWLVTGSDIGVASKITLNDTSWRFWGEGGGFGTTVQDAGDVDGDGISEILVSAPDEAGLVYLFSSASLAFGEVLMAEDADVIWTGDSTDAALGVSMTSLGDINADGLSDLALGSPGSASSAGTVFMVHGSAKLQSGLVSEQSFAALEGDNSEDESGTSLAVGNLDGDDVQDLVIGAPMQITQAGRIHVISGVDIVEGTQLLADAAFVTHTGTTVFGNAGTALVADGDVDGDGLDDLLIGGPGDSSGGGGAGAVWLVISGWAGDRALADSNASFWGGSASDRTGIAVGLGDLNGDSLSDLVIGVPGEDSLSNEGAVYIGYSGY